MITYWIHSLFCSIYFISFYTFHLMSISYWKGPNMFVLRSKDLSLPLYFCFLQLHNYSLSVTTYRSWDTYRTEINLAYRIKRLYWPQDAFQQCVSTLQNLLPSSEISIFPEVGRYYSPNNTTIYFLIHS